MTHEYTILIGGRIDGATPSAGIGGAAPGASPTAIAWALDTVLAVGGDAEVLSISRGDSRYGNLQGARVVPLGEVLEPGSGANFAIVGDGGVVEGEPVRLLAVVRDGQVVEGELPAP